MRPTTLWLTGLVLTIGLLLGGGTRYHVPLDSLVELASLPLLGLGLHSLIQGPIPQEMRTALLLLACGLALIAVQLVPLPPAVWPHLPGREQFAETYRTAGIPLPWLPISLDPTATIRSGLALAPGIAIFLGAASLGSEERRKLCLVVIGAAFLNALWGLAQLMQGPGSPLFFYEFTSRETPVGLFGNRNHFAALLYCAMPLAAAWCARLVRERRGVAATALIVAYGAMMLGLMIALSRAGLVLGVFAGVASLAIVWPRAKATAWKRPIKLVWGGGLLVIIVAHVLLLVALGQRAELWDTSRTQLAAITLRAANAFFPVGSGLDTFVPVFGMFQDAETAFTAYANHAHNDWLEIWLEAGVPGALLLLAFLAWYVSTVRDAWFRSDDGRSLSSSHFRRAATVTMGLLLLHSVVDYPLRTFALTAVFALAAAVLARPAGSSSGGAVRRKFGRHGASRVAWAKKPTAPGPAIPPS